MQHSTPLLMRLPLRRRRPMTPLSLERVRHAHSAGALNGSCCSNGQSGNPAIGAGLQYYFGGTQGSTELFRDIPTQTISRPSDLDCIDFVNCRWRNVVDDALDWSLAIGSPDQNAWVRSMNTWIIPFGGSAVLVSPFRPASDNGRLVSDPMGCMFGPVDVTLTMWTNVDMTGSTQSPRMRVCSRLAGESGDLKADQCATVATSNGQPTIVSIRPPPEGGPVELVIVGDNFVTLPFGGVIFVRQVKVDGSIGRDCSDYPGLADRHPLNETDLHLVSALDAPKVSNSDIVDTCDGLSFPSGKLANKWDTPRSKTTGGGWHFALGQGQVADSLTGIRNGPSGVDQFAVASFDSMGANAVFHLVSRSVTVPKDAQSYFYCFNEFITTPAVTVQLCVDAKLTNCFYQNAKQTANVDQWTRRCPKLPVGTFKIYVVARYVNAGTVQSEQKSEVGFVPDVVTTDAEGTAAAC